MRKFIKMSDWVLKDIEKVDGMGGMCPSFHVEAIWCSRGIIDENNVGLEMQKTEGKPLQPLAGKNLSWKQHHFDWRNR